MNERPEQPPEGRLIAAALERSGLSIRKAAERAGISYGRWRQVTSGVQHVSPGEFAAVHAPARTVARMAAAVGVTPEQLETEGQRPDAAEALRTLAVLTERHIDWPIPPREGTPFTVESLDAAGKFAYGAYGLLRDLSEQGIDRPTGDQVFPHDERQAGAYDAALAGGYDPKGAIQVAATIQVIAERSRREQHRDRSGTRGA